MTEELEQRAYAAWQRAGGDYRRVARDLGLPTAGEARRLAAAGASRSARIPDTELALADPMRLYPSGFFTRYNPSELISTRGYRIIDQMRRDEQVHSAITFKKLAILAPGYEICPPKGKDAEWEPVEFLEGQLARMKGTLQAILMEVLTALDYGFSITEKVFEKRGGKVEIKYLKTRRPHDFVFDSDEYGNLRPNGLQQMNVPGPGGGAQGMPVDKFMIFTHRYEFSNWYGTSDLEPAYRAWWSKKNAYAWLNMLLERYGVPPTYGLYNSKKYTPAQADQLFTVLKTLQAASSGIIPRGAPEDLELWSPELATQAKEVILPAIDRYDTHISRAILMPGLLGLNPEQVSGSLARSRVAFDVFLLTVEHLQTALADAFQEQVLRHLLWFNYGDMGEEEPTFRFKPMTQDDKLQLFDSWYKAIAAGAITTTPEDEIHLREGLEFPERTVEDIERAKEEEMEAMGAGLADVAAEDKEEEEDVERIDENTLIYRGGPQPRHPKGSGQGGEFAPKNAGALGGGGKIIKSIPLKPTKQRAFNGDVVETKTKLTKGETGALAEQAVTSYLRQQGFKDADTLNVGRNNFPVDLVHDHRVIEVKAGLVSNAKDGQKWRSTIGQPGKAETAWLKKATPEEKLAWNNQKRAAILDRKQTVVNEFSKRTGNKIKGQTMTTIINPDTRTVDIYQFDGFHSSIRWGSPEAARAYVGSYRYGH